MARHGWWKVLIFVALLGLCSAVAVAAQGATFTDPQGRFSFTVPAGWQQGSPPPSANLPPGTVVAGVFNAPAPVNGNFNVVPGAPLPLQSQDRSRGRPPGQRCVHGTGRRRRSGR